MRNFKAGLQDFQRLPPDRLVVQEVEEAASELREAAKGCALALAQLWAASTVSPGDQQVKALLGMAIECMRAAEELLAYSAELSSGE